MCRERILKAIDESEAGKTRLAAYEERTARTMPERLEYDDKRKAVPAAHEAQPAPASNSRAEVTEGRRQVLGGAPAIGDADADAPGNVRPGDAAALARRQVTFAEGVRGQRPPDEIGNRHKGPVRDFVTPRAAPAAASDAAQAGSDMPQDSEHRDEPDGEMQENDDVETEAAGDVDMDLIGHIGSLEPSSDDFVSELMLWEDSHRPGQPF